VDTHKVKDTANKADINHLPNHLSMELLQLTPHMAAKVIHHLNNPTAHIPLNNKAVIQPQPTEATNTAHTHPNNTKAAHTHHKDRITTAKPTPPTHPNNNTKATAHPANSLPTDKHPTAKEHHPQAP